LLRIKILIEVLLLHLLTVRLTRVLMGSIAELQNKKDASAERAAL